MEWKKIYTERRRTAEEAIRLIRSGDRVVLGHAVGHSHRTDRRFGRA